MIYASVNEICTLLEKAAVGRGFDLGTGQWLSQATLIALKKGQPGLDWALAALGDDPAPIHLNKGPNGYTCTSRSVLAAGPALTDLHRAGLNPAHTHLNQSALLDTLLEGDIGASTAPFCVDEKIWEALLLLAAKTTVPASEKSRMGAGSIASDTD